jgi:predicted ferric reductase
MIVLFVVPAPMAVTLSMTLPTVYLANMVGIQLGVIAYSWMLAAIYLGTRPRWMDRSIGLPHLYVIHGVIGIMIIILAFLHRQLSHSSGWIKRTGDWALILFIALAVWSCVFMAGWLTSRIQWLEQLKRQLEHLARHEFSVWLHRLNLIAVLLVFIHVQLISYIASQRIFMGVFDTVTILTFTLYTLEKMHLRFSSIRGRISGNRMIAPRVHEIAVTIPCQRDMDWEAGDFAFIRFPDRGDLREYHPFSVVNAPLEYQTCGAKRHNLPNVVTLFFAIREDGDFTSRMGVLPTGTAVDVLPPYGRYQRFIEEHAHDAPMIIIAGGIGITPLIAVLEYYGQRVSTFVYTARRGQLLPYTSYLQYWTKISQMRSIISERRIPPSRLRNEVIVPHAIYLIAGPMPMQRTWRKYLYSQGISADDIYSEPFSW